MNLILACTFLVLQTKFSNAQTCTWRWTQPLTDDLTEWIGGSGTLTVEVDDVLAAGLHMRWLWDGIKVAEYELAASGSFPELVSNSRGTSSATRTGGTSQYSFSVSAFMETDNLAELKAESEGCSTATRQSAPRRFVVKYCNTSHFEPDASPPAGSASSCGLNCSMEYTCDTANYISENFTATCNASAVWYPSAHACRKPCNNTFFNAVAAPDDDVIVGAGQNKMFTCTCPQGQGFSRDCGPDGSWTDETTPCTQACNASAITRGTPVGSSLFCGGEDHEFNCNSELVCDATRFMLQCNGSDGTWISTEDNCSKALCNETAIKMVCGQYCNDRNVTNIACDEPFNFTCEDGAEKMVSSAPYCKQNGLLNVTGQLCQKRTDAIAPPCRDCLEPGAIADTKPRITGQ